MDVDDEKLRNRCRCRNLDDPKKIFQLVISAMRHINGKGATVKEIRCYITKYHRVPMSDSQLSCIVQVAVCKAEGLGFLRLNQKTGKYFIAATSTKTCPKALPKVKKRPKKKCEASKMEEADDEDSETADDEDTVEECIERRAQSRKGDHVRGGQRKMKHKC